MNRGIWYGLVAYGLWGFLPIYWKTLQQIPALEIMGNRVIWSLITMSLLLTGLRQWDWVRRLDRATLITFAAIAGLIGVNWYIYIWAVNAGFIVETSLGYFINPLVNVLLGALFLGERLRKVQYIAVGLAAAGVIYLTLSYGALPWIALSLAFTFGFYGLLKKRVTIRPTHGLTLETAILFPFALAYLLFITSRGEAQVLAASPFIVLLVMAAGVITSVPLIAFAAAAQRLTLTSLGLMQYMAPTLQFCIGIFVYKEPFSSAQLVGFVIIWTALLLYTGETIQHQRILRQNRRRMQAQAVNF